MEIKNEKMCSNEVRKVALLITEASKLGWDISGYGFADVNQNSGNVYLWLEDQQACLYIAPCGDDEIWLSCSCSNCGEEFEEELGNKTSSDIDDWIKEHLNDDGCEVCKPIDEAE